jgi:hypothetical protein
MRNLRTLYGLTFDEYAREAAESHVPPSIVARRPGRAVNAMPAATTGTR